MELKDLRGVGPTRIGYLRAMGITSLRDLLYTLPVRYEDQETIHLCVSAPEGQAMVRGIVAEKPRIAYFRGLSRVTASIRDESGKLSLVWFNQPWMVQQLPIGKDILLYGRIVSKDGKRSLQNASVVNETGWVPVYRGVKGIPAKGYRTLVREALFAVEEICPETLPETFRIRNCLVPLSYALREAHFPSTLESLKNARRRLSFESMLMYLVGVALHKQRPQDGYPMELDPGKPGEFWEEMPFSPTDAQRRVLLEILGDLNKERAMARLVQGDVGCGKTALAFGAVWLVHAAGYQAAMMAPTEILARQHYENAVAQLGPLGLRCRVLTGSTKTKERREVLTALRNGTCDAVFGTHALISEGVDYARLGLVITDEQHRFGVNQRSRLQEKGSDEKDRKMPHVLVMSATPIPRTLALILYGDLDLSVVDELPPGRKPVKTRLVPTEKRADMYSFLRRQIALGHQAYVVCPLVEDSDALEEVRSVKSLYAELTADELTGLRVGLTWGQQKSEEKQKVLRQFIGGELDVLVATTMIEVGVNVPKATIMIIENSERYGLSQLHQLRGRVGRGSEESWCFLVSSEGEKQKILCETNDGFIVSQKDLELRGPGDLMGTRQSGEMLEGFILNGDTRLLDEAVQSVRELEQNPKLQKERTAIEQTARGYFERQGLKIALN